MTSETLQTTRWKKLSCAALLLAGCASPEERSTNPLVRAVGRAPAPSPDASDARPALPAPAPIVPADAAAAAAPWRAGTPHPTVANVRAAAERGHWIPTPGYVFVNSVPDDLRVRAMTLEERVASVRAEPTLAAVNRMLAGMQAMDPETDPRALADAVLRRLGSIRLGTSVDPRLRDWQRKVVRAAAELRGLDPAYAARLDEVATERNTSLAVQGGVALVQEMSKAPAMRWGRASIAGFVLEALFEIGKAELEKDLVERARSTHRAIAEDDLLRAWHGWPVLLAELCHEYRWRFPRGSQDR